ncbi:hypothetical protein XH81_03825 [Bradyrhizobium sp. CCBAU 25360]|nr:hypothetical protein [Bradyrhizobium sp. CCBAU 25360]
MGAWSPAWLSILVNEPMEKALLPCRSFSLNFCVVRIGLKAPQAVVLLWVLIVCKSRRNGC